MPLEDTDSIDMGLEPTPGKIQLVITDAGITTDPEERMKLFMEKLKTYVGFIMSPRFKTDYPNIQPKDVSISVVCKNPPTEKMAAITQVTPRGDRENQIAIEFSGFRGSEAPQPTEVKKSQEKTADQNRPWWKVWGN